MHTSLGHHFGPMFLSSVFDLYLLSYCKYKKMKRTAWGRDDPRVVVASIVIAEDDLGSKALN